MDEFNEKIKNIEERLFRIEKLISTGISDDQQIKKRMSAKEFLLTKAFKSEVEKTLLLAYYLERMEGIPSFNINDVVRVFQAAKEKKPANPSDAVAKNIGRGFVMEISEKKDGKKAWMLTATGERYVEENLNKS